MSIATEARVRELDVIVQLLVKRVKALEEAESQRQLESPRQTLGMKAKALVGRIQI